MTPLRLLQAALAGCLLAVPALAQPADPRAADLQAQDKATGCRVLLRPDWRGLAPRWSGPCPDGSATGLGVLRLYDPVGMRSTYYGEMDRGTLSLGVIDAGNGYIAGRFVNGTPVPVEDRNVVITAFQRASEAARAMSEMFRQQKNAGSASFYAGKAERLANQMD